uniref:7TM_GPCR_Srx domain-containing protein n=1 Tax=Steinernema glaseri TaxID=37863 RepID=A0A1I7YZM5_9BILA
MLSPLWIVLLARFIVCKRTPQSSDWSRMATSPLLLQIDGRGFTTTEDIIAGVILCLISFTATTLGILNLYILKTEKIFRNSFGWFAAWRTSAELFCNLVQVFYCVPLTLLQPQGVSLHFAFGSFITVRFFGFFSCLMQLIISVNRLSAVFCPLRHRKIFSRSTTIAASFAVLLFAALLIVGFFDGGGQANYSEYSLFLPGG